MTLNRHEKKFHDIVIESVRSTRSSANNSLNSSFCDSDTDSICSVGSVSSLQDTTVSTCSICARTFKNAKGLKMHVLKAHKDSGNQILSAKETENMCESNSETSSVISDTSSVRSLKKVNCWCFECDRTLKTAAGLNMHRRAVHVDSILTNKSPQIPTTTKSEDRVSKSPVPPPIVTENVFKPPLPPSTTENIRVRTTSYPQGGMTTKFHRETELEFRVEQLRKKWGLTKNEDFVNNDPLLHQLTTYHTKLHHKVSNILTEKLSEEVREVIHDTSLIDTEKRGDFQWTGEDRSRLEKFNEEVKKLKVPESWTWAAKEGSNQ